MTYAEEIATFLVENQSDIVARLQDVLGGSGYMGSYSLQAGFNEMLLSRGIEHGEAFIIAAPLVEGILGAQSTYNGITHALVAPPPRVCVI